jgi:transposase
LVGLPAITVVAVDDGRPDAVVLHIESRVSRPGCPVCGTPARVEDRPTVELVDLPCFGRPARLVWRKHRWCCPDCDCAVGSWIAEDSAVAPARAALTDRVARWATCQVGRLGRTVVEVARELGCDWHTVDDAVMAYGAALIDPRQRHPGGRPVPPGEAGELEAGRVPPAGAERHPRPPGPQG